MPPSWGHNTATSASWEFTLEFLGHRRAMVGCYYLCKSGTTSVEGAPHVAWVTSVGTEEALSHISVEAREKVLPH